MTIQKDILKQKKSNKVKFQLNELLEYIHYLGKINERPVFKVSDYKNVCLWEHELKGRIGIQHDLTDSEGHPIWLKIERLRRIAPPDPPEIIKEWLTVKNDPYIPPDIKDKLIKTLPESEIENLIKEGILVEDDIHAPLKKFSSNQKGVKDVIFRLENIIEIKLEIDKYVNEKWLPWSEEEKKRRETIKIYDKLFAVQQTMEAHGEEQPIELIWGIGVSRWLCEGHKIDHPLIEQPVEIEIDESDGSLIIHPRSKEPSLAVSPYFALENPGVEFLLKFAKKHFNNLPEDLEFSPFIHTTFAPILRYASTVLSEKGIYWPDINENNIERREPPPISNTLTITDSWVIYVKPRSLTSFLQDIERFKETLKKVEETDLPSPIKRLVIGFNDEEPVKTGNIEIDGPDDTGESYKTTDFEIYFPKPFNEAQIQIIERLEKNDGVVVQGPPGTGKTHTIANIICHYLATGRKVLVTSKGEPALTVLQEQIPEDLRELTISLLTSERQGVKQLEIAVRLLANIISSTNLNALQRDAKGYEQRVNELKRNINQIDSEIREWSVKQLKPIDETISGTRQPITAMELARMVIDDETNHKWLPDDIGHSSDFEPKFSDSDIAELRETRRILGKDIAYVEKRLPSLQDLPDSLQLTAIHNDLVNAHQLLNNAKTEELPLFSASAVNSIEKAETLLSLLQKVFYVLQSLDDNPWLKRYFYACITGEEKEELRLLDELFSLLDGLIEHRKLFLQVPIFVPNPENVRQELNEALDRLIKGKKAFSLFSFGKKEAKALLDQIKVEGEKPTSHDQWRLVRNYIDFQEEVRQFIIKWNHLGQEFDLPELTFRFGSHNKKLKVLNENIKSVKQINKNMWSDIHKLFTELFSHSLVLNRLYEDKIQVEKIIKAIELNISYIRLNSQRIVLESLLKKIIQCDGEVTKRLKNLIENKIGNPSYNTETIMREYQSLLEEIERLHTLAPYFEKVSKISQKIAESGARQWAELLKTTPVEDGDDPLTPSYWFKTWQWKRQNHYLKKINGGDYLRSLFQKRNSLDIELKKSFLELVRLKTYIRLHLNMTDRIQSALMRFVSAVKKIPKTKSAKSRPRYRREAYNAMRECYEGVPCWIMPTWRISESLPSKFGSFDLVIIDEASQSDCTALPALLRAKKILIVGDDKQVSPSATFLTEEKILQLKHNYLKSQPFGELLLPGISLYDLANALFPSQRIMLQEHFRCVEPIIRFSMQFYDEPLIPLRIPTASERLDPPLIDVYVPGGMRDERKKINETEVEAIVEEIKKITSDPKYQNRSIGVISLIGAQQANAIQGRLLDELGEEIYQKYKIVCGDSATFQGKERDIIFLSMVVGPGQGVVLNKREYEQRFNVALSRARDRMYLYRSIQESDLTNENDLRLKVIRHFVNPMPHLKPCDNQIELCDSEFERDVYRRLVNLGYSVIPQVKVGPYSIDLVVEGENDRRLAIELDGDKYHPPEKWVDDWKRQRTMERVGWNFWRCWGSNYILDPEGCISDLVATLNSMGIYPTSNINRANIFVEHRVYRTNNSDKNISHTISGKKENKIISNNRVHLTAVPLALHSGK